ncbi:MAG: cryptochrome/photolyase family protein [Gammaproteobacteria bacterium]
MATLRLILGDQLSMSLASLRDCDKSRDIILMCEVQEEATYVKHHPKKIILLFSAMRHFAQELTRKGYQVDYIELNDPANTGSFDGEVQRALTRHKMSKIVLTYPGEYRVLKKFFNWQKRLQIPIEILEDDRFLCSIDDFKTWAGTRKQLRMEFFYREMRKRYNILMQGDKPIGDRWNYDSENRKPATHAKLMIPSPYQAQVDAITQNVIELVSHQFNDHFGAVKDFNFAVTREQALRVLNKFITQRLVNFGDYQDAMLVDEPWMYHGHISFYLNCGLLLPLECIQRAQEAYHNGTVPLNAAEGFIRQIMGWREYVRGVYWLRMPDYKELNFLQATRKLPQFYWDGNTQMHCLAQCIQQTKQYAYAHHIQRLMVLGNFALLAGIDPVDVNAWYLIVYADAYEWVELPNVTGMILFADGGYLASKPYAAGGAYIAKMSNYCKSCAYDVKQKAGEQACPFNYLYWDFLLRNKQKLEHNQRLSMVYKTLKKMTPEKISTIKQDAQRFLSNL